MDARFAAFAGLFATCLLVDLTGSAISQRLGTFDAQHTADYYWLATTAASDSNNVKHDDLLMFATYLARAGLFKEARAVVQRLRGSPERGLAETEIAVIQVATAARADPQHVTSFAPVDALGEASSDGASAAAAANYWLIAEQIINRSPTSLVSPELSKFLHAKVLRREPNATLRDLLNTRWPNKIAGLPEMRQGLYWDYLAKIWVEIGDYRAATETLERAEKSGAYNFQGINLIYDSTARTWLEMGEIDRALDAARNASSKSGAATIKIDAAKALIAGGDKDKALLVLDGALADIHSYLDAGSQTFFSPIAGLRSILNLRQDAGDNAGARGLAEEMVTLAIRPNLLPAGELALAAAGYNDLGEHERAAGILRQAMAKLPGANQAIGIGGALGLITGSTLDVGDSIRAQIAVEFYRAGDRKAFEELLHKVSPEHRSRIWTDLYETARRHRESEPSQEEVINELPAVSKLNFLNSLATTALSNGNLDEAKGLLQRVIIESEPMFASRTLAVAAKVAVAGGFTDLARKALLAAARAALNNNDSGQRASDLALIAALQRELLND